MEQWAPLLALHGVSIEWRSFASRELQSILYRPGGASRKGALVLRGLIERLLTVATARRFDLVYVFREAALLGPAFFECLLDVLGSRLVFDFDDAIYLPNVSETNKRFAWLKSPGKTRTICRIADHVIAGNEVLAEYALRFNPSVSIVPTTIDTTKYSFEQRPRGTPAVIGWSGSVTTLQYLEVVRPALQRLSKLERFRFRVIGTDRYDIPGVDVEAIPWRSATEVEDLRPIDIGLMPLPDDPWTRGKCALKALQYMALGVPAVCSPVGVNTRVVRNGENGLLAATHEEWEQQLVLLLRDEQRRLQLGAAARRTVEREYSAEVQAPRVLDSLRRACGVVAGSRQR